MKVPSIKWRVFLFLTIALVGWLAAVAFSIWSFGSKDHAKPTDCAIVLGAAVYGTQPSPVFEERIKHAVTLYQAGTIPKIIFTGGFGEGNSHAESTVGAAYAVRQGVPASAVLTETKSRTTRENLIEAKALMKAESQHTAILST